MGILAGDVSRPRTVLQGSPRVNTNPPNRMDYMIRTSVDGFSTSPGAGPITGLDEEVWDDPVSPGGKRINLRCSRTAIFPVRRKWYLPVEYDTIVVAFTKGNKRRGWRNGGAGI